MILDGHIHIREATVDQRRLLQQMAEAGVAGGIVLSLPPPQYRADTPPKTPQTASDRLANVLEWCVGAERLYPFFWIDPMAADAPDQVAQAAAANIAGFKIICDRFAPGDARAMPTYHAIAHTRRPVLFHSGILWDGKPSSAFNRPSAFEPLLDVDGLRFALAHIAWPWCDELIAVYGKFLNAYTRRPNLAVEMYVDTTPGTPVIYRREALTKLFTVGYDVERNVMFGSDSNTSAYGVRWVREWVDRDTQILDSLGLSADAIKAVFSSNVERFLGIATDDVPRRVLRPGE